jgi:phosphatidylserine/phosphatidylglycerophosphate/cardiolipin synthase-like enzyme
MAIQQNFVERWAEAPMQRDDDALPQLYRVAAAQGGGQPLDVQVVRTIPRREPWDVSPTIEDDVPDPFTGGRRNKDRPPSNDEDYSTLESYGRAIVNAQRFIYIENQYFTCTFLVDIMRARLRANGDLSVVILLPRESELHVPPDAGQRKELRTRFFQSVVGERIDAGQVIANLRSVAPDRVFVASRINAHGKDVYVHAKIMIVDDIYAIIGSGNLSYRSMFRTDQELGVVWVDPHGNSVREFRRKLWFEHLEFEENVLDQKESDAASMAALWRERAADKKWEPKVVREWEPVRSRKGTS